MTATQTGSSTPGTAADVVMMADFVLPTTGGQTCGRDLRLRVPGHGSSSPAAVRTVHSDAPSRPHPVPRSVHSQPARALLNTPTPTSATGRNSPHPVAWSVLEELMHR